MIGPSQYVMLGIECPHCGRPPQRGEPGYERYMAELERAGSEFLAATPMDFPAEDDATASDEKLKGAEDDA